MDRRNNWTMCNHCRAGMLFPLNENNTTEPTNPNWWTWSTPKGTERQERLTPIPRRKAGDLHFPRELVYLCKKSFGADVEILAGQTAAMAPKKSLVAQPKFQTKQHSILLRYRFWDTSSGIMCRKGGEPVTEVLCSTALVLWNAIKIIVSNPLLLILAIMSIARRKLRS